MLRNLALITCSVLSCLAFGSEGEAPLLNEPPKDVSVLSIIQSFAAKEKEFKQAREQYAYTQEVTVRASCQGEQPGVYHLVVDMTLDGKGNRVEKIKTADSTLQCISITKEDLEGFRNQSLLLVTTDEIPNYQIKFVGQQHQGDLNFYVFDVLPVGIQVGKPQFEGRIWVNSRDFVIVKSHGTIVIKQEKKRKGQENPFPAVTTLREQIDGRYWFPAYSRANDVLHSSNGEVQIDEVVKLTNYKAIANSK